MDTREVEVVVIGAGPAGLLAAAELDAQGIKTAVLDELPIMGGQISRRSLTDGPLLANGTWDRHYRSQLDRLKNSSLTEIILGHTVWGIFDIEERPTVVDWNDDGYDNLSQSSEAPSPWFSVMAEGPHGVSVRFTCKRVIISTGAYDAPVPVPGWTLPGVVGAGSLQTMAKAGGIAKTARAVIAGSHPLAILAADSVIRSGARVDAVLLSQNLGGLTRSGVRSLPHLRQALIKAPQLIGPLIRIRRHGARLVLGAKPTGFSGESHVQGIKLNKPVRLHKRSAAVSELPCNVVALGYGLLSNTELAKQAECETRWDLKDGGALVVHDSDMQTTREGVYVAGEGTGVSGAEASAAEGSIAGMAVAASLKSSSPDSPEFRREQHRARRWNGFGAFLRDMAHQEPAFYVDAMTPESVLCRCESVTRGMADDVSEGLPEDPSGRNVKMLSRLGMGPCQARYCGPLLKAIESVEGRGPAELKVRVPTKPITPPRSSLSTPSNK